MSFKFTVYFLAIIICLFPGCLYKKGLALKDSLLKNSAIEAAKKQEKDCLITEFWAYKSSDGGMDIRAGVINISKETLKKVSLLVVPYDGSWSSLRFQKEVFNEDPIKKIEFEMLEPGEDRVRWCRSLWFKSTVKYANIELLIIEYMNGTTKEFSKDEINRNMIGYYE